MNLKKIVWVAVILCGLFAYKRAKADNNDTPASIKNLISRIKNEMEKNTDSFPALIRETEEAARISGNPASSAILHSMAAQMYAAYYNANQWKIDRRTPLSGYVPADMEVWTRNIFTDTIEAQVKASLADAPVLQQTKAATYSAILEPGKNSPELRPTLFDFLSYRGISILEGINARPAEIDAIYRNLIAFRKKAGNPKALLLAELDYLQYQFGSKRTQENDARYLHALDSLQQRYASDDFSVEIAAARIDAYASMIPGGQPRDSIDGIIYRLAQETLRKYPRYNRIGIIQSRLNRLTNPFISSQSASIAYPGDGLPLKLTYKNLSSVTISVYKSRLSADNYANAGSRYNKKDTILGEKVNQYVFRLDVPEPYTTQDTTVTLPLDRLGAYIYVISTGGKTEPVRQIVSVSRLFAVTRTTGPDATDILVTDYKSGEPVANAEVILYTTADLDANRTRTLRTDKNGIAAVKSADNGIKAFRVTDGQDRFTYASPLAGSWWENGNTQAGQAQLALFSDRSIYRPGQTVFFKGIAYSGNPDNPHVVPGNTYTVVLRDANNQEIAKQTFTTDDYGSFNGRFVLPQETLNGYFSITAGEAGAVSFQVAEYKRPSFAVDFLPLKEEIRFGENVYLHGTVRTFSGANLAGSTVNYRIVRRPLWPRYGMYTGQTQVAEGTTTVGNDGTFTLSFRPEPENNEPDDPNLFYRYEVMAQATNSAGETQEGSFFFSVGNRSLVLSSDISGKFDKTGTSLLVIRATNLNNQEATVQGSYTLSLLQDTKEWASEVNASELPVVKKVYDGLFTSGHPIAARTFASLPSGRYRLTMEAKDTQNRPVKASEEFVLYSPSDRQPPIQTHTWLLPVKTEVFPGETAEVVFGTSDTNAYILYEILADGQVLDRQIVRLNDANKTFRIPFTAAFGNGADVSFTLIRNGQVYNEQVSLLKKFPDRQLTIRPETFRDRLRPGQRETWSFRITDADSVPVAAEMLAGMYDAALDKLAPHAWYFNPIRLFSPRKYYFSTGQAFESKSGYASARIPSFSIPEYRYDQLNWQGILPMLYSRNSYGPYMMLSARATTKNAVEVQAESTNADIMAEEEVAAGAPQQTPAEPMAPVQLRQNFDETAFFYPDLTTDAQGNVRIEFTLPESNTTWKFLSVAYTKDLKHGSFTKEVVSQKELMVLPNLPRFLRRGDVTTVSTQVINLSDKALSGRVRLELFNPADDRPVGNIASNVQSFSVPAQGTTEASWSFAVPEGIDLVGCRIIAETPEASDGEQHLLPILPDEVAVTESKPFVIPAGGDKTIRTGWTSGPSMQVFGMTLEVAGNPAWYAIQALPSVTLPQNEDAVAWFAAYYTNTLATYIARSYPKVQNMIRQWEKQGGDSETLYSNLRKNQELKSILLEETPWVLAAKNETEQKQQLSLLFNINHAENLQRQALDKLAALQAGEGGWSWYKGMPASPAITLYILKGMSQLTHLGAVEFGEQEKQMQIRALDFLDKNTAEKYTAKVAAEWKNKPTRWLTPELTEYLFVRSGYRDIPEYGDAREAIRFYTGLAEKEWKDQSLYGKALIAQLLFRNGQKQTAGEILASLRKTATTTETMGMYWANNRYTEDFFVSPVSVHCQLMDAFDEIAPERQELDRMKQWLLMQKQTQRWESVPATVNAIYALLSTGSDWFGNTGNTLVTWGDHRYETAAGETGTEYIQETLQGKEITPALNTVSVQKTGDGPAWGAVYRQYFEKADRIKAAGSGLSVEKKLFVTVTGPNGPVLVAVTPSNPLKTGDKVTVRLVVTADRTMDYVQLKDMRAACFEPVRQTAGVRAQDGLLFYESPEDASQNFFFNTLLQGTYVMEYTVYVTRPGEYSGGIATIQCLYAPEFVAHTEGNRVTVR
ncbi:MAG: alpha-2-macroglobulin [Parabacteroides sp.]|nr:alpha-2-macroglobulin [Parabacteroides sp.]